MARSFLRDVHIPDQRFMGSFRGEPGLEKKELHTFYEDAFTVISRR